MTGALSAEGLTAYAAVESRERERVREAVPAPVLDWLEHLGTGASSGRGLPAQVQAVLALAKAEPLQGMAEFARVLGLLSPHEEVLRELPGARALLEQARRAQAAQQADEATRRLERARQAFDAGQLEEAVREAEELQREAVEPLRGAATELLTQARARLDAERLRARFDEAVGSGRSLQALALLREAERTEPGSEGWTERRAALEARLSSELRLEVCEPSDGAGAPEYAADWMMGDDVHPALDAAGESWFWATAYGRCLFVRRFAVGRREPVTLVSLQLPEPMDLVRCTLSGGSLFVVSAEGAVLELTAEDWRVRGWSPSSVVARQGELVENQLLIPGTKWLWLSVREKSVGDESIRLHDLERGRLHRELREGFTLQLVLGGDDGPRVFSTRYERTGNLYEPHGVGVRSLPETVKQVELFPGDGRPVALTAPEELGPESLELLDGEGRGLAKVELEDSWCEAPSSLAVSKEARRAFVLHDGEEGMWWLSAFAVEGEALRQEWRREVSEGSVLVQDVEGRWVVLVEPTERGPRSVVLGAAAPEVEAGAAGARMDLPSLGRTLDCGSPERAGAELTRTVSELRRGQEDGARRTRVVDELLRKHGGDAERLVELTRLLRDADCPEDAKRVAAVARQRFAANPWVALDEADEALSGGDWRRAEEVLATVAGEWLAEKGRAHWNHLVGLALYHQGRFEEAAVAFERTLGEEKDPCWVRPWPEWLRFLAKAEGGGVKEDSEEPLRLLAALKRADALLSEGDGKGAQSALDTSTGWKAHTNQVSARLAAAALLQEDVSPEGRFRKRLLLAAFLKDRGEGARRHGRVLPLGGVTWEDERLAALVTKAGNRPA